MSEGNENWEGMPPVFKAPLAENGSGPSGAYSLQNPPKPSSSVESVVVVPQAVYTTEKKDEPTPEPAVGSEAALPAGAQNPEKSPVLQPSQPTALPKVQPIAATSPAPAENPMTERSAVQQQVPLQPTAAVGASAPGRSEAPVPPSAPTPPSASIPPTVIAAAPPQKRRGWIVAIVISLCILVLGLFAIKSCTDLFGSIGGSPVESASLTSDSIAIIDIDGTIAYDGTANSPEGLYSLLQQAEENDYIKGVVLRVNSGGGTATAGEEMAAYVADFSKPIVVSSASINASAAYEISSQADYIYVAKTTEIGSIGTVIQITDISGLLDMLGIDMEVITSSESKDSSYGYRPLSDYERQYYQDMVDQINRTFIQTVADGRAMGYAQVEALATGLSYTGIDAVANGLADEIGTREDALAKAAALAGIDSYTTCNLVIQSYGLGDLEYLLGNQESQGQRALDALERSYGVRIIE